MALIRLLPAFKGYLWDETKLEENYGKKIDLDIVAEGWGLFTHKDGQSIVSSGEHEGPTLSEYVEKLGKDALGTKGNTFEFLPILIKFIDIKGDLSIQVHPDNEYTLHVEKGHGKTEIQYILDAEEGASLCYGTNKEITKDELRARIEDSTILDILKKVPIHKGDVFFIKSGTIHAIGGGIIICEIRQNFNTTYRICDFRCVSKDEKPRELHIEEVIDVPNLTPLKSDFRPIDEEKSCGAYRCATMTTREYLTIYVYDMKTGCSMKVGEESSALFVIVDGRDSIESDNITLNIRRGDSVFASANTSKMTVKGSYRFILSRV